MNKRSLKIYRLCLLFAILVLGAGCSYEAKYNTRKVNITMQQVRVSAGFVHFSFETDQPAYFLSGITRVPESTTCADLLRYQEQFKLLMLDSAYVSYLEWRRDKLANAVHDVADFRDHCLQYTSADQQFQFLQPETRYIVFAFVVDPVLRQPAGDLRVAEIVTAAQSEIPMRFAYRVNGYWDYVYPVTETRYMVGNPVSPDQEDVTSEPEVRVRYDLLTDVPWGRATVDSLWLREQGWGRPGAFFIDSFTRVSNATNHENVRVYYGLYAHDNAPSSEDPSELIFLPGHTYYTGLAMLDGSLLNADSLPSSYAVYRFRWNGPSTQIYFNPGDSADTRGAW